MLLEDSMSTVTRTKPRQTGKSPAVATKRVPVTRGDMAPVIDETLALLALSCIRGVGYWTLWKLRQLGQTFAQVLDEQNEQQVRRTLKNAGAQLAKSSQNDWVATREAIMKAAKALREELSAVGVRLVHRGSTEYPWRLNELQDPPFWLFVQGRLEVLNKPAVTIVGTRNPTDDGLWLSRFVGECLHELACPTVSGLAAGIDQLVHEASIRAKVPTVAVLGTGMLSDYPKGSEVLRKQIVAKGGAVITEYLPRQSYSAENFVRRNRLQAALGSALVPVEWAAKSGTAHTVKYAADLERPIACLRMPDWPEVRSAFNTVLSDAKELFTIPGDEKSFRQYIKKSLRGAKTQQSRHPDLFTSD
jgi:DNA processing protein